jgi:hypothetical protein
MALHSQDSEHCPLLLQNCNEEMYYNSFSEPSSKQNSTKKSGSTRNTRGTLGDLVGENWSQVQRLSALSQPSQNPEENKASTVSGSSTSSYSTHSSTPDNEEETSYYAVRLLVLDLTTKTLIFSPVSRDHRAGRSC